MRISSFAVERSRIANLQGQLQALQAAPPVQPGRRNYAPHQPNLPAIRENFDDFVDLLARERWAASLGTLTGGDARLAVAERLRAQHGQAFV